MEFENIIYTEFYNNYDNSHEFSAPTTTQRNEVVERKNRTLQEIGRVMQNNKKLPMKLWAKVVSTICYIINRVYVRLEFSKEEEITNSLDENVETSGAEQIAEAKSDNVATSADTISE